MKRKTCRYAWRARGFPQLLCEKMLSREQAGKTTMLDKARAVCGHQYFCPETGQWESTIGHMQCPMRTATGEGAREG